MPPAPLPSHRARRHCRAALWLALAPLILAGCATGRPSREASYLPAAPAPLAPVAPAAEATLAQAQELDRSAQPGAVDLYYRAAAQAASSVDAPGEAVYRQALHGMIDSAQRYGRLDACRRAIVVDGGARVVPIRLLGFAWRPQDFSRLSPVEQQTTRHITNHYANPGLGLPLVAERVAGLEERYFRPTQPFAVTAVLRPADAAPGIVPTSNAPTSEHVLDLYNPRVFQTVAWNGAPRPLARDLTAPLAAGINDAPPQFLVGFTAPTDVSVQPKLVMSEPYQRGKIPVIFIHGLASDPTTWAEMGNELGAQRDLYDHFQFWTFRYPTGGELLDSAAALRDELRRVRDQYDGQRTDPAMDSMVLVGHSLGGLVSKMQVTTTYDILWREIANQPITAVRAGPQVQMRLRRDLFYEPVPMVKRVIMIGTPHQGSGLARRLVGIVASRLVKFGSQEDAAYKSLMDDNPDVFKPIVRRARPTTVNMLDPDSPILAGLAKLPVNPCTHLHSIIGTGGANPFGPPGDGVVTVASARHYGDTELFVPARHEQLHRDPQSISEVARILRVHASTIYPAAVARRSQP